ncbi:hypothetical protein PENANT_c011G05028 [Penicillium antarcticum]|uniref:Major facilitator superfamily (MFS) profile domain-containing protein n=1 Tax=Penicillium antarcticum TaxID=416450 RepID=A0A1V6Q700_9EURO|nr:uncharacterized protein N7508_003188 [Penicillium antarcticum]KAJ5312358.1 hypothetical protein N7508_003188 [Penicillium antarcticum]OQD85008.1 hypothetical protein PENANT_c011G05028 [Penicillium antarcticum]
MEDTLSSLPEPWLFNLRSSKQFIGFAVFVTTFADGFLYGIVVAVLPFSLTIRFGVPEVDVPFWTSTSLIVFGLAMTLGAPIAGWIVGKCERSQIPFLAGLLCAFGSTLFFMFGWAPWMIIVARVFQGLSAGVVYTAGLTLLVNTIESHELGPWIGFGLSGMNFGVLVSPTLGGIIYEKTGFYPVFIMSLAVIAINLVLILLIIDKKAAAKYHDHVSRTRPISSNGSSPRSAVANGKRRLSRVEDGDATVTTSLLVYCRESPEPAATEATWWTVVGGFLSSPRILTALYASLINVVLVSAMDAVLPIFVKQTFHWLSGATGAIFLNLTIPSLMGPFIGMLSDRYGVRFVAAIGFIFAGVATILLALVRHNTATNHIMACVLLLFVGIGLNASLTPLATEIPRIVKDLQDERPDIYGHKSAVAEGYMLLDAMFGAGTVLGPFLSGVACDYIGWTGCTIMLGVLSFSAIVPIVLYLKPHIEAS